jgi:hypothetical protein
LNYIEAFDWNTDAHSTLRQQEFRSRVLTSKLSDKFERQFAAFLQDTMHQLARTEQGYVEFQPAYQRSSAAASILDFVYAGVLDDEQEIVRDNPATGEIITEKKPACKIQGFVRKDEQQKRGGKSLGYDALKSSLLKEFVQQSASDKDLSNTDATEWPRQYERRNLVKLCDIITEEMLENRWQATQPVNGEDSGRRKPKVEPTPEAVAAENLFKKGALRIWSRKLKEAIALMLRLAGSDYDTIFQRHVRKDTWDQIRVAVRRIADYRAWANEGVVALLGGNVIGQIEAQLNMWADMNQQPRLDAYYLANVSRPE